MNIATSYFYQIRFFKRNMIPLSTALWDPKWYHDFQGPTHCYIDKNGVLNGLRISSLVPGDECNTLCRGVENCQTKNPMYCDFLREYRKQLNSLNVCELRVMLEELSSIAKSALKLVDEPILVLCFMRGIIIRVQRE